MKIEVIFMPVGDAPIMKKKKWSVDTDKTMAWFIYVAQAFCPSLDQKIENVYHTFGNDGKLILHYCKTQAWG
ncbi:unnamed protein product [Gordionus sp. m RMFG-2023]